MHASVPEPSSSGDSLPQGVYESVVTETLDRLIEQTQQLGTRQVFTEDVAKGEETEVLAQHLTTIIRQGLEAVPTARDQHQLAQKIIATLGEEFAGQNIMAAPAGADAVLQQLTEVAPVPDTELAAVTQLPRPVSGLTEPVLLTNSEGTPQIGSELRLEMASADRVDVLIAFIKWSGLRVMEKELQGLAAAGVPFRILTSTYLGASDAKAIHRLATEFGGEVRVNHDGNFTRLHAKAWMFHRKTGFSTAYVGSSNLSQSAQVDGLEWNVRLSSTLTPRLLHQFEAAFDSYWESGDFIPYAPSEENLQNLRHSLQANRFRSQSEPGSGPGLVPELSGLEVRPYPHQEEILEQLQAERTQHGRHRNLIVAATGTGKTVVAGLDYQRLADTLIPRSEDPDLRGRPRLLFLAHRVEILQQSLRTFQEILGDGNFGEILTGNHTPEHWNHVFASVQTLSRDRYRKLDPDHFDVIIIDEFHHAEARTYRAIIDYFAPQELIGLTATPERADGVNVQEFFDNRIASEMRLWHALEANLLVPFHYFGIADTVDLSAVSWSRGRYDAAELSTIYTGNDARVRLIIKSLEDKLTSLDELKGVGFCVSVEHAEYMAQRFNAAGIAAAAIVGETDPEVRRKAQQDLRTGAIKMLFAVDVLNEGVDIPEINTVLFLRPTESSTIFLQQLGRGLRRAPEKAVLTVLDFVGHQRKEFNFGSRLRALTGRPRGKLVSDVEQGFPYLPGGSHIVLDERSQQHILDNLRSQIRANVAKLGNEATVHLGKRSWAEYSLAEFLADTGFETTDVYRSGSSGRSWSSIKAHVADAGFAPSKDELKPTLGAWRLLGVNDEYRASKYRWLLTEDVDYRALSEEDQRWARMLYHSVVIPLLPKGFDTSDGYQTGIDWIKEPGQRFFVSEALQVLDAVVDAARINPQVTGLGDSNPLRAHASYTRAEVMAALDVFKGPDEHWNHVEGTLFSEAWSTDAFFVNLHKSEREFSPSTLYRDYAISPTRFHWESPNIDTPTTARGQRFLSKNENGTDTVFFVRSTQNNDIGTAPFVCLGTANLHSWTGQRPLAMQWELDVKMPQDLYLQARTVA